MLSPGGLCFCLIRHQLYRRDKSTASDGKTYITLFLLIAEKRAKILACLIYLRRHGKKTRQPAEYWTVNIEDIMEFRNEEQ